MIQTCRHALLIVLIYLGDTSAWSQTYEVDTASIREVVTRWNEAHNQIDEDSFRELYAPTVLFYANYLGKKACLQKKFSLLNKGPFSQRITSDLRLAFYEEGIVYCGFTKEVTTAQGKKSYPSYLLLKRVEEQYLITGESDLITDRNLKFHLALGPQVHISELSAASPPKASTFKFLDGVVLFLLVAVTGAAVYFFSRKPVVHAADRKLSKNAESVNRPIVKYVSPEDLRAKMLARPKRKSGETADARPIDLEKGHAFEQFVVNRFRQKGNVFKWMDATSDKGSAGHYPASNINPDLQYEFRAGSKSYPFSVECKFRSMSSGAIQLTSDGQLERYKKFKVEKRMDVFIVLLTTSSRVPARECAPARSDPPPRRQSYLPGDCFAPLHMQRSLLAMT